MSTFPDFDRRFGRYKAFLFDMDGTMINNMAFHEQAWHAVLAELGVEISHEALHREMYGKNPEVFRRIMGDVLSAEEIAHYSDKKEALYRALYRPHIAPVAGLMALLQYSQSAQKQVAMATAANLPNVDFVLDALPLRAFFHALITADDVQHGKPNPEVFLLAAQRVGVSPADCLVFEDAPAGAQAAHRAGMDCYILTTTHPAEDFAGIASVIEIAADFEGKA